MRRPGVQSMVHGNDPYLGNFVITLGARSVVCEEGRGGVSERLLKGSTRGKYANRGPNIRFGTSVLDNMKLKIYIPEG